MKAFYITGIILDSLMMLVGYIGGLALLGTQPLIGYILITCGTYWLNHLSKDIEELIDYNNDKNDGWIE